MRKRRFVAFALLVAFSAFSCQSWAVAQDADKNASKPTNEKKSDVTIQKGSTIKLELQENLSSQDNKTGDVVHYKVVNDVKVGDTIVIAAESEALGRVVEAKPAKGWGKGGKLDISVETAKAVDGKNVPLVASMGDSNSWAAGKTILGVAILGLAFGGGMKGKKVTIPKGATIDVFIGEDTVINTSGDKAGAKDEKSAQDAAAACLNFCQNKSGDDFKTCMDSCNKCKDVCKGLEGENLKLCITKCL